jgi:hypothetical protein
MILQFPRWLFVDAMGMRRNDWKQTGLRIDIGRFFDIHELTDHS